MVAGNWSISLEQVDNDYHPDFCAGFLYLTTPSGNKISILVQ